ncbi:MAG: hypothetical protein ACRD2J_10545 [Thermoanaerobaculia bacterium]
MLAATRKGGRTPDLRWFHPAPAERYHELRGAGGKVASIRWAREQGTLATGEWGSRVWSFKRFGFFHPKITIRRSGSEANLGRFEPNMTGGGVLHLAGGVDFRLVGNFWRGEWRWVDPAGHDLLEFKRDFSVVERNEGHLTWVSDEVDEERFQLLALFGWYVVIMLADDAAHAPALPV